MLKQLINDEKFTNIQKAQAGLTRLLKDAEETGSFYRVMKNDTPLGVLLPENVWSSITEDIEALSSPDYRKRIKIARQEKKTFTLKDVKKQLRI